MKKVSTDGPTHQGNADCCHIRQIKAVDSLLLEVGVIIAKD